MRWLGRVILGLTVIAIATAVGPTSAAAAGWQPAQNAATTGRDSFARVAVDGQGDAVAVWARFVPLNSWEIVAASRPRGGQWGSYTTLTRGHRTVSLRPKVAVDPNGNAVALWVARPPEGNENVFNSIWASERTPDGQWSEPYEISVASGARGYELVIDAEGTATALWYSLKEDDEDEESEGGEDEGGASPGHWFIRSSRRPLGGSWSPPADISGPTLGEPDLALAANATGDVAAVWRTTEGEYVIEDGEEVLHVTPVLRANQRPADGDWAAESDYLAEGPGGVGAPVVTVGAEGDITAAWPYQDGGDIGLRTAYRSAASGEWDAPTLLWDDVYDEVQPGVTLASGSQGETGAIWSSFEPGGHVMRFSENVDGTWSEPVVLAGPGGGTGAKIAATNPWLVFDPQGNLTATRVVAGSRIQAAHRPAGEDWGEPVWLSGFDDLWEAQIAVDPEGYVTAIWAGDTAVRSRVYDAVAPTLGSVTVPTEGVVGDQIAMAAEPFDVWSAVTTTWDLGDGGDATGASVAHCYEEPGLYTVTITGNDLAANQASVTREIEIVNDSEAGPDPCAPPEPGPDPDPDPDPGHDPNPGPHPGAAGPGSGLDRGPGPVRRIAPAIEGLRQSAARWRLPARAKGTASRPTQRRLPIGTSFRFRLNRAARVELTFFRIGRNGETVRRGAIRRSGARGSNTVGFSGRIGRRTLTPGRYRVTVVARAAGMTSDRQSISFTIAAASWQRD